MKPRENKINDLHKSSASGLLRLHLFALHYHLMLVGQTEGPVNRPKFIKRISQTKGNWKQFKGEA